MHNETHPKLAANTHTRLKRHTSYVALNHFKSIMKTHIWSYLLFIWDMLKRFSFNGYVVLTLLLFYIITADIRVKL